MSTAHFRQTTSGHVNKIKMKSSFLQKGVNSNKENKWISLMLEMGPLYGKHTEYGKAETEDTGTRYLSLEKAQILWESISPAEWSRDSWPRDTRAMEGRISEAEKRGDYEIWSQRVEPLMGSSWGSQVSTLSSKKSGISFSGKTEWAQRWDPRILEPS